MNNGHQFQVPRGVPDLAAIQRAQEGIIELTPFEYQMLGILGVQTKILAALLRIQCGEDWHEALKLEDLKVPGVNVEVEVKETNESKG